jgi:hypothetical protein
LSADRKAVSRLLDGCPWKLFVRGLELLKRDHLRFSLAQPGEQVGQAPVDVVDVEGGDLHGLADT